MRLIDADKIIFAEIDEVGGEYEPYLGCSKSQINHLPTVKAIPLDRVEQIRAEIKQESFDMSEIDGEHYEEPYKVVELAEVLNVIDKALKEQTDEMS